MAIIYIFVSILVGQTFAKTCFKDIAVWVLEHFKKKSHQSATNLITAVGKIIKSNREIPVEKSAYPSLEDMSNIYRLWKKKNKK